MTPANTRRDGSRLTHFGSYGSAVDRFAEGDPGHCNRRKRPPDLNNVDCFIQAGSDEAHRDDREQVPATERRRSVEDEVLDEVSRFVGLEREGGLSDDGMAALLMGKMQPLVTEWRDRALAAEAAIERLARLTDALDADR